ncbi:hypothetical protein MMC25_004785 [Agyrium rufum]|nr:hypothetical protein [Agyrium rufum]
MSSPVSLPGASLSIATSVADENTPLNQGKATSPLTHRSHDPSNNLKRSDPFQFGSRYLLPTDDPFEFNAWDHVTPSAEHVAWAETQYAFQREHAVSAFDATRFNTAPEKWWDKFYANNTTNFFKDRKWLRQEFPILDEVTKKGAGKKKILEVGAGAGNTAFPVLRANENEELYIHACDFSKKAVTLIRENEAYDEQYIDAVVWDIASDELPERVEESSIDVVLLIFVFSALSPMQWEKAVRNTWRCLKDGGEVCFRDYGRGDLAQVRFKKGRLLEDNFYVRGDGTRVYFFEEDELRGIWSPRNSSTSTINESNTETEDESLETALGHKTDVVASSNENNNNRHRADPIFEVVSLGADRRMLVNRQRQLQMYRCWLQGKFRKPTKANIS